jgi:GNAT superfamily N-acetyltransferase
MDPRALTFVYAATHHFDAIARIERAGGVTSVVTLTAGRAIDEAVRRGHYVIVALEADEVTGWIWFSVDAARGGEEIGQMFRVAVLPDRRRFGVGRALVEHAQTILAARDCKRVRATLPAGDDVSRAFMASLGYAVDAVTMDRPL